MTRPLPQPVRIYRVGGSVRDELLGLPPGDSDWVVVGATPEMMIASGFTPVGRDFPVFLHPETRDEYALARTERKHGRGYRGFEFFATPDVTLEDDLRRRDLTINAMARDDQGALIDPYGGERDLRAGILRHVSEAFAEDPLRVLRVARFAARFDFRIEDETLQMMRAIAASGELATIAPERVFAELARGLMEAHPSRLLRVLRETNALGELMPEIAGLYAVSVDADDAGMFTERALEWSAAQRSDLRVRYAVLTQELDLVPPAATATKAPRNVTRRSTSRSPRAPGIASARAGVARVAALSNRMRVPVDCHDAASLAVRWHRKTLVAATLAPADLLALVMAADALRRPERLDALIGATGAHVAAKRCDVDAWDARHAHALREAVTVVREVDAAAIARDTIERARDSRKPGARDGDRIRSALRDARLAALRAWKRARTSNATGERVRATRDTRRRA